jgi:Ca2+-binding RTX toxin-like protein
MPVSEITLVSSDAAGNEGNSYSQLHVDGGLPSGHLSEDGRYVIFESTASNLVPGDSNGQYDIFVRDLQTGNITRVSTDAAGVQANNFSTGSSLSADGRYAVFTSYASNLVPGEVGVFGDIFVKDLQTGAVVRASVNAAGTQGNSEAWRPSISGDGRYVVFISNSTNLIAGETNGFIGDAVLKDLQTGSLTRVSTSAAGVQSNVSAELPGISANGLFVVFQTHADNLVAGDGNGTVDIFVKNVQTGAITLASSDAGGNEGNNASQYADISADGRYVVFESFATNLVAGDTNEYGEIFLKDIVTGAIALVSTDAGGNRGNNASTRPSISADGRYVAFSSNATNLVVGDTGIEDIYVKDMLTGAIERVSVNEAGQSGNAASSGPAISGDGRTVAFMSAASNLVAGDTNANFDVFVTLSGFVDPDSFTADFSSSSAGVSNTLQPDGLGYQGEFTDGTTTLPFSNAGVFDVLAGSGNDTIQTGDFNDTIVASAGHDAISAGAGHDSVEGGAGDDTLVGGAGDDTLDGGADQDTVDYSGAAGAVSVNLSTVGAQLISVAQGSDTLIDIENIVGSGLGDTLTGNNNANRIDAGNGGDTVFGVGGNDLLIGGTGPDTIDGGADNDTVAGGIGDDSMTGGTGVDTADYSALNGAVTLSLSATTAQVTGLGTDTISGFENVLGGIGNDKFIGTTGANVMEGAGGSDQLNGLGGNDMLVGGSGNDNLQGGAGNDTMVGEAGRDIMVGGGNDDIFVFNVASESAVGGQRDRINDFVQGADLVDVESIDAMTGGADDDFVLIDSAALSGSGTQGELRYFQLAGPGQTIVEGDIDGNGTVDFQIAFVGLFNFNSGDFLGVA